MTTHLDVAKRWAERSGPLGQKARDLHGFHMFTEGDRIYSYGHHFLIGTWETLVTGERVAFLNSGGRSISTTRHQSITRSAIHRWGGNCRVFHNPFGMSSAALLWYAAQADAKLATAKRARKYGDRHRQDAADLLAERDALEAILEGERSAA